MAPHLETIDVPAGVEDAAAIALDHPFVVDALAWGLRSMVDLLAEHNEGPGSIELGGPARMLRERLEDLYAGRRGAAAARCAPHAAAAARPDALRAAHGRAGLRLDGRPAADRGRLRHRRDA